MVGKHDRHNGMGYAFNVCMDLDGCFYERGSLGIDACTNFDDQKESTATPFSEKTRLSLSRHREERGGRVRFSYERTMIERTRQRKTKKTRFFYYLVWWGVLLKLVGGVCMLAG